MKYFTILFVSIMMMLSACGDGDRELIIAQAEEAIADNQPLLAQESCDSLLSQAKSLNVFSVNDLCRLSILYMKLSEINRDKEEVNVSAATRCYRQALKNNADSVREYVRQVPMEDVRHIELLRNLVQRLDNPTEIADDEDESEEEFYESEEGIDENVAAEVQPQ